MGYRVARVAHVALMIWLSLLFLPAWLGFLQSLAKPDHEWSARFFAWTLEGAGLDGDYGYLIAKAAAGVALIRMGWRRPNGLFRLVLPAFLALILADGLYGFAAGAEPGLPALALDLANAAMLVLAWRWSRTAPDLRASSARRTNRMLLGAAVMLLPVQYALLRSGVGQPAGLWLAAAGWALFSASLAPWRGRLGIVGPARAT